jgi:hypothetical protein
MTGLELAVLISDLRRTTHGRNRINKNAPARITPRATSPPSTHSQARTPRPDDPLPRTRPLAHLTVKNRSNAHPLGPKRKVSATGSTVSPLTSACQEAERQRKLGKAPSFIFSRGTSRVGLGIDPLGGRGKVDKDGFLVPGTLTRVSKKARTTMSAGVVEIGTKARSVTGREKYRGKVFNVPAKVEEETRAEESVIDKY